MTRGHRLLAGLTVVAAVLGGCDTVESTPKPPEPTVKPVELTAMPWTVKADQDTIPQLRDGVVLYVDQYDIDGDVSKEQRIVLADAATGTPRWTSGGALPGGLVWDALTRPVLVAHDGAVAVLVEYCTTSCVGNPGGDGIALLSGTDGSVLWQAKTVTGTADAQTRLHVVDDDTAVVTVQPGTGTFGVDDPKALRVLAFDLATGKERWETSGVWPQRIAGDVLLGAVGKQEPPAHPDFAPPPVDDGEETTVAALDLATGRELWRTPATRLVAVAGNSALVFGAAQEVVDALTGQRIADFADAASPYGCAGNVDSTLIACATRDAQRIRTFDTRDRSMAVSRGFAASTVWRDRVIDWDGDPVTTVDRAGNRVDDPLPGAIIDASGDFVLVADMETRGPTVEATHVVVHRLKMR
jgi:hypothetical protein